MKEDIFQHANYMLRIIEPYIKNLKNLGKMDRFLHAYNLPKLRRDDIYNQNKPTTKTEIESIIKTLPTKKIPGPDGFTAEIYHTFQERIPVFLKLPKTTETQGILPICMRLASSNSKIRKKKL